MLVTYVVSSPRSWRRLFAIQRTRYPIPSALGAGCDGNQHSCSGTHGQHRRHGTTEVVPRVETDHRDPSGRPKLSNAEDRGRVPQGPSKGRTMSISTTRLLSGKAAQAPP